MKGQRQAILNHLRNVGPITSMQAFTLYGITRLSAIIHDLKGMGYPIITVMIDCKTRFGSSTKCARYILGVESEEE